MPKVLGSTFRRAWLEPFFRRGKILHTDRPDLFPMLVRPRVLRLVVDKEMNTEKRIENVNNILLGLTCNYNESLIIKYKYL